MSNIDKTKYFVPIFQTGDSQNFQWRKSKPIIGIDRAYGEKRIIEGCGHLCVICRLDDLEHFGMPTVYVEY